MIIELHLLQSFPVSNLNRDDVGQPKTATFGGHTRGRISSQCLKRSARLLFNEYGLDESETGVRTKRLLGAATARLVEHGRDAAASDLVVEAGLESLGFGLGQTKGLTQYLFFVGREAAELLADYCDRHWDLLHKAALDKQQEKQAKKGKQGDGEETAATKVKKVKPEREILEEARRILDATRVADVALFGRMIADNKGFNVNAASQVAHAISTHAVVNEYDYYTAVDDLKPGEESGADMIGTVDFNAACYYRYANLDLEQLQKNLDGDTELVERAARAWLYAFTHATPSGKRNSMAARTMPETLLSVVREHGAWNLANAFLKPVSGAQEDLMAASADRLFQRFEQLRRFYGDAEIRTVAAASVIGDVPYTDPDDVVSTVDEFASRVLSGAEG